MIGRTAERQAVLEALAEPGARVQVGGPPGIGKSTLAHAVVDGTDARWVALGEEAPLAAVARRLGVPVDAAAVRGALDDGVIVLDGAEAVADVLPELLAALGDARVLVTSRQRIPGVRLVELGPLGEADGVALFQERAATVGAVGDDPAAVRELVRRLEGWPLALELAASRTRLYAPRELLAEPPLRVLADGSRPEASLERALDASWALLDPADRACLARVALFQAPFDRDGFLRVSGSDLGALERLMDASLVRWSAVDGGRRYHLLAPIRAYALERLGDDPEARDRYAEGVLQRAERAMAACDGARAGAARAELGRLAPDLEALVGWGASIGARAALALGTLARAWGPLREAEAALHAVDRAGLPPELAAAVDRMEADLAVRGYRGVEALAVLERLPADASTERLRGLAHIRCGDLVRAVQVLERSVELADAAGDPRERAECRYALGVARLQHGSKWAARDALRDALEQVLGLDAPDLDGLIRKFLVLVERDLGVGYDARRAMAEAAVSRHVQSGNLRLEVMARNVLAMVAMDANDPDVVPVLAELEVLAKRAGVTTTAHGTHIYRAMMHLSAGRVEQAADELGSLVAPDVAPFNQAWAIALQGVIALLQGRRDEAILQLRRASDGLASQGLRADVSLMNTLLALLGEDNPPDLLEPLPPEAPLHVAREVALHTAAGEALPPSLEAMARRSAEARLVLTLALAGAGTEVAATGEWFVTRTGERVDLSRRRVLSRVLAVLAAQGGRPITHEDLLAQGWPGEVTTGSSGRARVHVAVSDLRRLGLRDDLQTVERDGGAAYRLRARIVS